MSFIFMQAMLTLYCVDCLMTRNNKRGFRSSKDFLNLLHRQERVKEDSDLNSKQTHAHTIDAT